MLTRWLELYRAGARRNAGEPDAGRFFKTWALDAGFRDVRTTSSTWTYADPQSCAWWGGLWADRCELSSLGEQAIAYGLSTREELRGVSRVVEQAGRLLHGAPWGNSGPDVDPA